MENDFFVCFALCGNVDKKAVSALCENALIGRFFIAATLMLPKLRGCPIRGMRGGFRRHGIRPSFSIRSSVEFEMGWLRQVA